MAKGKADFIFQRKESNNWSIKLRSGGQRIERSLGTRDRRQAEVLALPMIADHKARLLEARARIEPTWRHELEPGREHVGSDCERIFATDRELYHLDAQGVTIRTAPNGGPAFQFSSLPRLDLTVPFPVEVTDAERTILAVKNSDDALFETYVKHANITGYYEREARAAWALYKQLTDNKPLKDATRDDGRKVVEYFGDQDIKSATIQKKIGWLTAAVNIFRRAPITA
jgi:hypothetical protein